VLIVDAVELVVLEVDVVVERVLAVLDVVLIVLAVDDVVLLVDDDVVVWVLLVVDAVLEVVVVELVVVTAGVPQSMTQNVTSAIPDVGEVVPLLIFKLDVVVNFPPNQPACIFELLATLPSCIR